MGAQREELGLECGGAQVTKDLEVTRPRGKQEKPARQQRGPTCRLNSCSKEGERQHRGPYTGDFCHKPDAVDKGDSREMGPGGQRGSESMCRRSRQTCCWKTARTASRLHLKEGLAVALPEPRTAALNKAQTRCMKC